MKHRVREGVKLCFDETGSGSPPVVLVHGWTCNRSYFAPQRDHLAKRHRVVSVDLRGHGESDKPKQPYPIPEFADDLAWLCRELRVEKPVVIGHSMGGMIALEVAARHPDLPGAIVACDSPIVMPAELVANLTGLTQQMRGPDWRAARLGFISDALFIAADDSERKKRIIADMTSAPDHVALGCWEGLIAADTAAAASKCKVPFLYIAADAWIADAARLRQLCPHVVLAQTAGAGHFHQLEVPDQVNAMIDRFFQVSGVA